jgi:acetyltransferase-like isoleucine patch superfamily enzyme
MIILRKILRLIELISIILHYRRNKIKIKVSNSVGYRGIPFIRNEGKILIGDNVKINSKYKSNPIGFESRCTFVVKSDAIFTIGKNSGISNSTFICWKKIHIGENVMIGGGCKFYDTDFHPIETKDRINNKSNVNTREIVVEDNVFIGAGSIILKGSRIGKSSIIGAGSVVSKIIPPNEIWAGNPARCIKKIEDSNETFKID